LGTALPKHGILAVRYIAHWGTELFFAQERWPGLQASTGQYNRISNLWVHR